MNHALQEHRQSFRPSGLAKNGGNSSSFDVRASGGKGNRSWEVYSSNTNLESNPSAPKHQQRKRQPSPLRKLSPFRSSGRNKASSPPRAAPRQQPNAPSLASSAAVMAQQRADRRSRTRSGSADRATSHAQQEWRPQAQERTMRPRSERHSSPDNREPRRFEEDRQMRQRGQVRLRFSSFFSD